MRPAINLATNPFVSYRRFALAAGTLGVIGVGAALLLLVMAIGQWQETTSIQGQIRQFEAQRATLHAEQRALEAELRAPTAQELLGQVDFLNQLIRRKSLSWTQLFFDLQERLPERVRILTLAPSVKKDGSIRVELGLGGDSTAAIIEFLEALPKGNKFRDVELHSQGEGRGAGRDVVTAQVSAVYVQD
ncbi:MAG: hypothetical protein ACRD35_01925 [Candidatus Acidiferrales bacterium]